MEQKTNRSAKKMAFRFCMSTKLDWLKTIKLDILNIPDNRYNLQQDNQCGPERILKRLRKGD